VVAFSSACCDVSPVVCAAELIVDEFGEKLLEELDYQQEARNIEVSESLRRRCGASVGREGPMHG
jgi:predicted unusual protein kinase regulating ubiquinone biosynthesis (AarF/ABC1/UbiB family)